MIYSVADGFLTCPGCGGFEFKLEERFELKETRSPDYEKSYNRVNTKKCIVCVSCGRILDESYDGHTLGIF